MATTNRREKEKQKARKSAAADWAKETSQYEPTAIRLPEGKNFWDPAKPGLYKLRVVPYSCGKNNPRADEGFTHFIFDYHIHRIPGLDGKIKKYCCPARMWNKRCYPCIWMNNEGRGNEDRRKQLLVQDRLLMNVIDLTADPGSDKIEVLDQPYGTAKHPSFGQILKDKINTVEDYKDFAELSGGYVLHCKVIEDTFPGGKYLKITNIEMVLDKREYEEDIMDGCITLDECPIEKTYDELKRITEQEPTEEDGGEEDEEVERGSGTKEANDDEEEETAEDNHKKETPLKIGDRVEYKEEEYDIVGIQGGLLTLEDDDGEKLKGVKMARVSKIREEEPEDEEDEGEEDSELEPEDDEGDSDLENETDDESEELEEDEDEDEPEPPKKKPATKPGKKGRK